MGKNKEKNRPEKLRGADGFEKYYGELYGSRWESLKASLAGETVSALSGVKNTISEGPSSL